MNDPQFHPYRVKVQVGVTDSDAVSGVWYEVEEHVLDGASPSGYWRLLSSHGWVPVTELPPQVRRWLEEVVADELPLRLLPVGEAGTEPF